MNVKRIMHSKSIMSLASTSSAKIFFHIMDYPLMLILETYIKKNLNVEYLTNFSRINNEINKSTVTCGIK